MTAKKPDAAGKGRRTAGGSGGRGRQHAARARKQSPGGTGTAPRAGAQEAPAAPGGATPQQPPAGLDDARHAAAQRTAHQAEVLRKGVFPSLMATALALDNLFDAPAYKAV